ncbi:MAG: hypothetical protein AAFY44_17995 [Pseudomonadota bacterium]
MLPFPKAHWYVGAFLVLTFAAFMPSYFAVLPSAPWVHHLHGITATLWIVLIMTQNWSAHRRCWKLHALSGMASMALVPVFTIGGLLVTQNTLLKDSVFKTMFGQALSAADFLVSAAFVLFYTLALRHRRHTAVHARYMLATVILLLGPSLARFLAGYVPGFFVRSLETLPKFGDALDASFVVASTICLMLIIRDYRNGQPILPFFSALLATIGMVVVYYGVGYTEAYASFAAGFAALPAWQIAVFAWVTSAAAVLWAWRSPVPAQPRQVGEAAAATPKV